MDILSHFLWTVTVFKIINLNIKKAKEKTSLLWAGLWGIFPDIFSFGIAFIYLIYNLIVYGGANQGLHALFTDTGVISSITTALYSISHSVIIFLAVFSIAYLIFKKPIWVMGGWLLHILIDIPVHDSGRWATQFLWPFSNFAFNGAAYWQNWWVEPLNYGLLILVWIILLGYEYGKKR
jgi:hypothetical protein